MNWGRTEGSEGLEQIELTANNFDDIVGANQRVVVDFWAQWCKPCIAMNPIVEKLSHKYNGEVAFGRVDIERHGRVASRFKIFSIPTFLLFKNGKPVDMAIGAVGEKALEEMILRNL
jgi:thioredoxin 1